MSSFFLLELHIFILTLSLSFDSELFSYICLYCYIYLHWSMIYCSGPKGSLKTYQRYIIKIRNKKEDNHSNRKIITSIYFTRFMLTFFLILITSVAAAKEKE